jgi:hypothetical protein
VTRIGYVSPRRTRIRSIGAACMGRPMLTSRAPEDPRLLSHLAIR